MVVRKGFPEVALYPVGDKGSESMKLEGTDVEFYRCLLFHKGIMVTGKESLYGYTKYWCSVTGFPRTPDLCIALKIRVLIQEAGL